MDHLMNVYNRMPVTFIKGEGVWLWDTEGHQYLDALSGMAVSGLGHAHPAVTEAILKQTHLLHTSNLYRVHNQELLAATLCRLTGLDKAFFCNSGAEAVEAALKLIRLYGHQRGIEAPQILVMEGAFHGRTLATLSAGASTKARNGFHPFMPGFIRIPYNDIKALEAAAEAHPHIVAVLMEPVQGESGIHVPHPHYLKEVRSFCTQHKWLMVLDEIQTGIGRTGHWYAYQEHALLPDILISAKGLANGIPIGACLATDAVASLFTPGVHGSTFGGNPFATGVALATLKVIEERKLWENAALQGRALLEGLKQRLSHHPHIKDIRGKGLMVGIELDRSCRELILVGLKHRLLFTVCRETTLRLLPPLIIEREQIDQIIDTLCTLLEKFPDNLSASV